MDSTEDDISARVLLRRVLHTELPRSPVTRSATIVRRSMRLKNTPGLESPGSALRHRLKKKLHESASLSPLPSPKRPRSTVPNTNPPVTVPSPVYDEDMTTRGLLRGIIQMETEASLLMSGQPALQASEPNPAEASMSSAGERTEGLSGVELSDLTLNTEPLTHVVRGLSRRKLQRAFSASAFEKQLDQLPEDVSHVSHKGDISEEKADASQDLDWSSGSKSGLNLTLKTPFVEKRIERVGLQRKVSNRRLPSVDAFDEAVQRCLEQGPSQDHSVFQDGKTLEDSSWQKFTLCLNDVTELYVQPKKDDTVGPSAEMERDAEYEREHELERASEIPDSGPLIQGGKDHELESQDDDEEDVVPSSQEDVFLSPEDDIVLAPTQAMTESLPESCDVELQDREFVEEVEIGNVVEIEDQKVVEIEDDSIEDENVVEDEDENVVEDEDENVVEDKDENVEEIEDENVEEIEDEEVEEVQDENVEEIEDEEVVEAKHRTENPDTSQYLERITRRAHRSEGGGSVLGIPAATRVTKSFGAGLNPREKDLLDFIDGNRDLQDFSDEEREPLGSPEFPQLHPAAELSTPEQRSQQHEASLAEEDVPELEEDDDAPEELNQSEEEEELMDSGSASQSPELPQEEEEEEEEDDDDDALSAELSMKTPAFVRQKRVFTSSIAQAMPTVLKEVNAGPATQVAKRAPRQKRQTGVDVLPKSYVMSMFKHFAKTRVASDIYPAINEILKKYFERLADDLEAYTTHAKRKTIEVEDFELLMRRQGFVTDSTPVNILIEKYLPLEYRKLLIPVASSGNKVIPKQRR
ncbi:transcriptional regulator ATRX-like isoform X2 [Sinocyclocheilus anshuiensis]|uniref:transcriptional regulator ATRX-like isoform X2 n=1 Tax=Sinocyclocheilus anshuiensis TaxID=1608454 RepID=UPI0007B9681A|nr:PREDICTED: transcriptional regulator ATRX-like isoform X2 [Sinocyclocheilus anshuiensis]